LVGGGAGVLIGFPSFGWGENIFSNFFLFPFLSLPRRFLGEVFYGFFFRRQPRNRPTSQAPRPPAFLRVHSNRARLIEGDKKNAGGYAEIWGDQAGVLGLRCRGHLKTKGQPVCAWGLWLVNPSRYGTALFFSSIFGGLGSPGTVFHGGAGANVFGWFLADRRGGGLGKTPSFFHFGTRPEFSMLQFWTPESLI